MTESFGGDRHVRWGEMDHARAGGLFVGAGGERQYEEDRAGHAAIGARAALEVHGAFRRGYSSEQSQRACWSTFAGVPRRVRQPVEVDTGPKADQDRFGGVVAKALGTREARGGDDFTGAAVGGLFGGRAVFALGRGQEVFAPVFGRDPEGRGLRREAVGPDGGEVAIAFTYEDGEVRGFLEDPWEGAFEGADIGEVGRAVADEAAVPGVDGETGAQAEVDRQERRRLGLGWGLICCRGRLVGRRWHERDDEEQA